MLRITIGSAEMFNEETMEFEEHGGFEVELEHSLLSLSKWESRHMRPFLGEERLTIEETKAYIMDMVVSPNPPENLVESITPEDIKRINDYIESPQSATTFGRMPERKGRGEVITAELIYYWLVAFQIPFDPVEAWHLNRLMALVRIANIKNDPKGQKKMSKSELARRNYELNEKRKQQFGTRG